MARKDSVAVVGGDLALMRGSEAFNPAATSEMASLIPFDHPVMKTNVTEGSDVLRLLLPD
jgi:hypothetical protein